MKPLVALVAAGMLGSAALAAPESADTAQFARHSLHVASYRAAQADLDGDGHPETLLYATDPEHCGTGGCALFVLTRERGKLRMVSRTLVVRPPVRVLPTAHRGWRDLAVNVSGGGITRPYVARLRFDGQHYPPGAAASPAERISARIGMTVIER